MMTLELEAVMDKDKKIVAGYQAAEKEVCCVKGCGEENSTVCYNWVLWLAWFSKEDGYFLITAYLGIL